MSDVTEEDGMTAESSTREPAEPDAAVLNGDEARPDSGEIEAQDVGSGESSTRDDAELEDVGAQEEAVSETAVEASSVSPGAASNGGAQVSGTEQAPQVAHPEPEMTDAEREKALEASLGRSNSRWKDPEQHPYLKQVLESLLFVSDKIITRVQLARIVRAKPALVRTLLSEIIEEYSERGIQLAEVGGGYQFRSAPQSGRYVRELVAQKPVRLTRAQLETLALVAYRQPITRPEIDDVRGVDTGSAVKVLLDRGLIKMLGRKDEAGRPLLYGTTPFFLEFFGLKGLKDLPTLKEFTELSDDSRVLFKRKTGEAVDGVEAASGGTSADREQDHEDDEVAKQSEVEESHGVEPDREEDEPDGEGDEPDAEEDEPDAEEDEPDAEEDEPDAEEDEPDLEP